MKFKKKKLKKNMASKEDRLGGDELRVWAWHGHSGLQNDWPTGTCWVFVCVCLFLFLGPHTQHMEVPRLRVKSEL